MVQLVFNRPADHLIKLGAPDCGARKGSVKVKNVEVLIGFDRKVRLLLHPGSLITRDWNRPQLFGPNKDKKLEKLKKKFQHFYFFWILVPH